MTLIDKERLKDVLQQAINSVTVQPGSGLLCEDELNAMKEAYEDAMACLERMPDALVRCKDCRFGEARGGQIYCHRLDFIFRPDWYCGDAERGEQDESKWL